jgi:hypothetical protein
MYSTIPIHWNIKSAPASLGRSRAGPALYIFSLLDMNYAMGRKEHFMQCALLLFRGLYNGKYPSPPPGGGGEKISAEVIWGKNMKK